MVASCGASMPAPLAIPPMLQPLRPSTTTCLRTVSVVMIAVAASSPPSGPSAASAASTPASSTSRSLVSPISPVEQTTTSTAPMPETRSDLLGDRVGRLEALGAGVAVGAAGVQDHGAHHPVLDDLLAPEHRVGLATVGGEHRRGGEVRAVVDDQRQVLGARRLQPGGDAGGPEPLGCGDAHAGPSRRRVVDRSPGAASAGGLGRGRGSCTARRRRRCPWRGCRRRRPRPAGRPPRRRSPARARRWSRARTSSAATGPAGSRCTNGSSAYAFSYVA